MLHPTSAVMLAVLFWILFSLMLLIVIPDRWHARREIAKATSRFVVLTVRERDLGNGQIQFRKNYVRLSDCRAGYGSLATTDLNGRVLYQNDFILQRGNVASTIAGTLCCLARDKL